MPEHFTFQRHITGQYPAWSTPNKSVPVTTVQATGTRVLNRFEDTGAIITKSRRIHSQGAVNDGAMTVSMRAYPHRFLPWVIRSFLTNNIVTPAGTGYVNDMRPDDANDVQLPWFSVQQLYNSGVNTGQNVRGAVINNFTITAARGEEAVITAEFVAADTSNISGVWSDSTSAPGPATLVYDTVQPPPFRFHEGQIVTGETYTWSGNKLNGSGGTVIGEIETFSLAFALNTEGRFAVRDGPPTIAYTRTGERLITFTGEIDWADYKINWYNQMKFGTQYGLRLSFVSDFPYDGGSNYYEMHIVMPAVVAPQDGGQYPDLDGSHMPKVQSISAIAMDHLTLQTDVQISFKGIDDLSA